MSNQIVISSGAKVRSLNGVITGTTGVLDALPINAANGIPQLDVNGKILVSQLPNSVMEYKGTWNANTNTPTLTNGGAFNQGDVYLCNVAGTTDFGAGPIAFVVGDQVIYSGSIWQRASGSTGTVTSVAVTETGDALTITGSPITTSGTINIGFAGTSLQYVAGNGALVTFPTLISSIGLSMPSAFSVANSPLTANGTLAVTGAGVASQYIRGDGTLADFPSSGGGGSSVSYYLNGGTSQGVIGGTTYYEMSKTADTGTGVDFPKTGNGLIVSFLTDANDPAQLTIPSGNWNYEIYVSMSANGGTPQLYAELYKYDGTTFTLISTSTNEILYDGTTLNLYTFAMAVPTTTLTVTDRLAVKLYATNSGGKTTTVHTQNGHLCQIITTFSTGITALNGLTAQVQYLATGTSGTDFNISSTTATHTFNIPDASASARGLITTGTQTIAGAKTFSGYTSFTFSSGTRMDYGPFLIKGSVPIVFSTSNTNIYSDATTNNIVIRDNLSIAKLEFNNSTQTYTFPAATGTMALTSDLSAYLPLAGGTLSGLLEISTASYLTSRLKLTNTATGGNIWSVSSGNANNSINNSLFTIINETLSKNTFVLSPTGKLAIGENLGTINPADALSVYDTNTILRVFDLTGNGSSVVLQATNTASYVNAGYNTTAIPLILRTANTTRLTIAATGEATFASGLTGTTANFTGQLTLGSTITNGTYTYTLPSATGTLALTSDLSAYLPLAGGTLTGALGGTSATFSGSVGVGSTGNDFRYYAVSSASGNPVLVLKNPTSGTLSIASEIIGDANVDSNSLSLRVSNPTNGRFDALTIASTGNVGISTSSPQSILHAVKSNSTAPTSGTTPSGYALSYGSGDGNNGGLWFSTDFGGDQGISGIAGTRVSGYETDLRFYTNNTNAARAFTERMRITSAGNVGIGTSAPSQKLSIGTITGSGTASATPTCITLDETFGNNSVGTNFKLKIFQDNASNRYGLGVSDGLFEIVSGSTGAIGFFTNGANERMRITSGGDIYAYASAYFTSTGAAPSATLSGVAIQNPRLVGPTLFSSGNVSDSRSFIQFINANGVVGSISTSGTATAFNTSSDYRLKQDLKDYNGLELISAIKTYDYEWKSDKTRTYGVLAHELQEVIPQAVFGEKDAEEMQGVDYSKIVPVLVKAIQEQQKQIEELKLKIK